MKQALVLSGGSVKGAFQAGAIAEVLNRGFRPQAIYGTSAGSLNGGFLVERFGRKPGITEAEWPRVGEELAAFWQEKITSFKVIGRRRNFIELGLALLLNTYDGLLDTRKLNALVHETLRREYLHISPIQLSVCSVDIDSGKAVYADAKHIDILEYIIASTAIPLVMPVKTIAGVPFVDGGIREVAPLKRAIEDGAQEIVLIACMPEKMNTLTVQRGNAEKLASRLMDILSNELVNNDIRRCELINQHVPEDGRRVSRGALKGKRYIRLQVIRPEKQLDIDLQKFNSDDIRRILALGREAAKKTYQPAPVPA